MVGNSRDGESLCQDSCALACVIEKRGRRPLIRVWHQLVRQGAAIQALWLLAFRRTWSSLKLRGRIPSPRRRGHLCGRTFDDPLSISSRRSPWGERGRLLVLSEALLFAPGFAAQRQLRRVHTCTLSQPILAKCRGGLMSDDARERFSIFITLTFHRTPFKDFRRY